MNQYVVNVIEHVSNYTYIIVNAENEKEARSKALRAYTQDSLYLDEDVTGVDAFICGQPDLDDLETLKQIN